MKPLNIFLIRHGESIGNKNKDVYKTTPDYALELTDLGKQQADEAGKKLEELIPNTNVQFYVSPFWRTRQTFIRISKYFPVYNYYEDPRLREQEWDQGKAIDNETETERDAYGHFYYRFRHGGESCTDVFDRISNFLDTMFRDFSKPHYPQNTIIVTHGMAMRVFLMKFFHCTVEEFQLWSNPKNCEFFHLKLCEASGKYTLITPLKTHVLRHNFIFKWGPEHDLFGLNKLPIKHD